MSKTPNLLIIVVLLTSAIGIGPSYGQSTKADTADDPAKAKAAPTESEGKKVIEKKGRGKFTISKETTYVTGPVDEDGYIDYATALNERLKQGVTPENNANVLIWKALGPHRKPWPDPSPDSFKEMGIQAPPEKGDYFIDEDHFRRERLNIEADSDGLREFYERLDRIRERPWRAKDHPDFASWLQANDKPLALVIEAVKRPQFYSPLVPGKTKGSSGLMGALGGQKLMSRQFAQALVARAMLRAGEGEYDAAWQDLLACHRLGRLVGRGPTLVEALIGVAIEGLALKGELAYLERVQADAKRIEDCLHDLQKLPPLSEIADKVNLAERFVVLEMLVTVNRDVGKSIKSFSTAMAVSGALVESLGMPTWPSGEEGRSKVSKLLADLIVEDIDWDPALRSANQWFDRLVAIADVKDRSTRELQWKQMDAEVSKLKKRIDSGEMAEGLRAGNVIPGARGKVFTDFWICLMTPAVRKVGNAVDRIKQTHANLQLAFALASFRCDHGNYPQNLDALAPKYLAKIPQDMFSGKALIYRPADKGFLLYSVGVNGKDDGGRGYEDEPAGDDLVIRMPLPEWKAK